jgi:hypothetical protein
MGLSRERAIIWSRRGPLRLVIHMTLIVGMGVHWLRQIEEPEEDRNCTQPVCMGGMRCVGVARAGGAAQEGGAAWAGGARAGEVVRSGMGGGSALPWEPPPIRLLCAYAARTAAASIGLSAGLLSGLIRVAIGRSLTLGHVKLYRARASRASPLCVCNGSRPWIPILG